MGGLIAVCTQVHPAPAAHGRYSQGMGTNQQMNGWYGRPRTFKPVAVQDRLPWTPRRSDGRVQAVLLHPLIADEFVAACHDAARACPDWVPQRCDSYVPREIRGYFGSRRRKPSGWKLGDLGTSKHSWASAVDFFVTPADVWPPGGVWTPNNGMPAAFAKAFTDRGWTWGGPWKRSDTPHLEFGRAPATSGPGLGHVNYTDWLTGMLKQGDTGTAVLDLQLGLQMLHLDAPLTATYGPDTGAYVRELQAVMGIPVDGMVGPTTEGAFVVAWDDQMRTPDAVVARAYTRILGRAADAGGMAHFTEQIVLHKLLPHQVARRLWESAEGKAQRAATAATPPPPPAPPKPAPEPVTEPVAPSPADLLAEQLLSVATQLTTIASTLER